MFHFGKKKEKERDCSPPNHGSSESDGQSPANTVLGFKKLSKWKPSQPKKSESSNLPQLTDKEVKQLQEAKERLTQAKSSTHRASGKPHSSSTSTKVPPKLENGNFEHPPGDGPDTPSALSPSVAGEHFGYASQSSSVGAKSFCLPGLNLPALRNSAVTERTIFVPRQPAGDFGFSLRRSQIVQRNADGVEEQRTVIFAEPLSISGGFASSIGLLPGDLLLEVNGVDVRAATRDHVVQLIKESADGVTLKVKPVLELCELSQRLQNEEIDNVGEPDSGDIHISTSRFVRTKSRRRKQHEFLAAATTNGEVSSSAEESVWLVHRKGFASALKLPLDPSSPLPDGKCRVKLVGTNDIIELDADDLEKANNPELDLCEDLKDLLYLNESSALNVLRQRYASSLIHTYAGSQNTLILTPLHSLAAYSEKVVQMFRGCRREDMPPHIYAVAQQMYRLMLASRRNQSCVMLGRSGGGKSTQTRHLLHYLCLIAGCANKVLTVEKVNAIGTILEAFGSCRTFLNVNASRFASVFTLEFDHCGQISSGSLQCLLMEYGRVVSRPEKEGNFHVFYMLWEGVNGELRKDLLLNDILDPSVCFRSMEQPAEREAYLSGWSRLLASLQVIGVSGEEANTLWSLLAAIIHLCCAGAPQGVASHQSSFIQPSHARAAATLLGIPYECIQRAIFHANTQVTSPSSTAVPTGLLRSIRPSQGKHQGGTGVGKRKSIEKLCVTDKGDDGIGALHAFIVGLYRELFNAVIFFINRSLSSSLRSLTSITVADFPGMQNPATCKQSPRKWATFDEFSFNYAQERLLGLFYDSSFTWPAETYQQENIEIDFEEPSVSAHKLIELIDKAPEQNIIRSTNVELRSQEKRGLLYLLDEESVFPGATDDSFVERFMVHYGDNFLLRKTKYHNHFVLNHALGTNPITYNVAGWLKRVQDSPVSRHILSLLQESEKQSVGNLFLSIRSGPIPGLGPTHEAGMSTSSMRRQTTTIFRNLGSNLKRRSYCLTLKMQMDWFCELIRRAGRLHFVHSLLPHHWIATKGESSVLEPNMDIVNIPLLRSQIAGSLILEAVRYSKIGFPERMMFSEFRRRYECLIQNDNWKSSEMLDDKKTVVRLLQLLDVDESATKLGLSQIFIKTELLSQLEDKRDFVLSGVITTFQAACRAYLARKWLQKRKVQQVAVRCIQRNMVKYISVRNWDWWRVYIRILPLISVQRTEEDLKSVEQDLTAYREKAERLEKAYAELRVHCDRLEAKLLETQSELQDERSQASRVQEMLEQETTHRIQMEKEMMELNAKWSTMERRSHKLELQAMEYRNYQAALESVGDMDEVDTAYKEKCQRLQRQLEAQKKQFELEKRENEEFHQQTRQKLESKVSKYQKEVEESRQQVMESKRKSKRAADDQQDLKLHLHTLSSRNNELEKKQKKFDSEQRLIQERTNSERVLKEQFMREKEELVAKNASLQKELQEIQEDCERHRIGKTQLEAQLNDLGSNSGGSSAEVLQLKRAKQSLDSKCADQEQELDDLAGQVQQLQQSLLKLEMAGERSRTEHARELDAKDEELEEARSSAQRRIHHVEQQLEEEYEEKQRLQKEIRELYAKFQQLSTQHVVRDESMEGELRRDLRRTKALLSDAQTMLHQYRSNAPNKGLLKQLKNQLDDAESEKLSALRAKQNLESELTELRTRLDQTIVAKSEVEARYHLLLKDRTSLQSEVQDREEELNQLLKKYKAQVQQSSVDHITLNDQLQQIGDLERQRENLNEQVADLSTKIQYVEREYVDKHRLQLAENRCRDLESKLELELSQRTRHEAQITSCRDNIERLQDELMQLRAAKDKEQEVAQRLQRQLVQVQDDATKAQKREAEAWAKKNELEKSFERSEQEQQVSVQDLKLALRRIDILQAALYEDQHQVNASDSDDYESNEEEEEETLVESHPDLTVVPRTHHNSTASRNGSSSSASIPTAKPNAKAGESSVSSTKKTVPAN